MMDPHTKQSALSHLQRAWETINAMPTTTSCRDCIHIHIGYCNLWKAAIPHDIIPKGCEKWQFDRLSPPV